MKSSEIIEALRKKFCSPQWVVLTEFQAEPGYTRSNGKRMDALVVNVWESGAMGNALLGVEIKVSRADFKNELKDPNKTLETYKYCDATYLACPKNLVGELELPPYFHGLIEVGDDGVVFWWQRDRFKIKKDPLPRCFFGSVARKSDPLASEYKIKTLKQTQKEEIAQIERIHRSDKYRVLQAYLATSWP
jgi:hypothetical protein